MSPAFAPFRWVGMRDCWPSRMFQGNKGDRTASRIPSYIKTRPGIWQDRSLGQILLTSLRSWRGSFAVQVPTCLFITGTLDGQNPFRTTQETMANHCLLVFTYCPGETGAPVSLCLWKAFSKIKQPKQYIVGRFSRILDIIIFLCVCVCACVGFPMFHVVSCFFFLVFCCWGVFNSSIPV